ncbi:hypothetical protein L209DRAFT_742646 [Thermothelomyces heterothallicus CBS 203.75]
MALRIRGLSQRALARRPICLHLTSSTRALTLSARLAASRRAIQRQQAIPLRVQRPPQPGPGPGPQTPPSPPRCSSRDEPKAESLATLVNQRRWPLFFIGLMALGMSFYISVVITTALKDDGDDKTFGLCSVADPAKLLANMAAKLQPDTGRIILLEHGRGVYDWINRRLDKSAPKHFRKFGCWWNRDIEKLVRDAAETIPGLEIVELDRPLWFQWGTTLLIELRLNSQGGNGAGQKA